MKARFAVASLLLVLGVALSIVAIATKGAPWGFRGHQAVVVEAVGDVEIMASDARASRRGGEERLLAAPGTWLDTGDELRVGRYGDVRLRLPGVRIAARNGAALRITQDAATLLRGLIDVELDADDPPPGGSFTLSADAQDAPIVLDGKGGSFTVISDGVGDVTVFVRTGSATVTTSAGPVAADAGELLALDPTGKARELPPPKALPIAASCSDGRVRISLGSSAAPAVGTQVFAGRSLVLPSSNRIDIEAPPAVSEVVVMARDVAGNVAPARTVPCTRTSSAP
jgi:hypothetical protein